MISLANNNPNEHEANAAARKVCRLLVELKVNFTSKSTPKQAQYNPPNYTPPHPSSDSKPDWYDDLFGGRRGGKSQPPPYENPDYIRQAKQQFDKEKAERAENQRREQEKYERDREKQEEENQRRAYGYNPQEYKWKINYKVDPDYSKRNFRKVTWTSLDIMNMSSTERAAFQSRKDIVYDPATDTYKLKKKIKQCTKCGKEQETGYVGNLYICNTCLWMEFEEQRKK